MCRTVCCTLFPSSHRNGIFSADIVNESLDASELRSPTNKVYYWGCTHARLKKGRSAILLHKLCNSMQTCNAFLLVPLDMFIHCKRRERPLHYCSSWDQPHLVGGNVTVSPPTYEWLSFPETLEQGMPQAHVFLLVRPVFEVDCTVGTRHGAHVPSSSWQLCSQKERKSRGVSAACCFWADLTCNSANKVQNKWAGLCHTENRNI